MNPNLLGNNVLSFFKDAGEDEYLFNFDEEPDKIKKKKALKDQFQDFNLVKQLQKQVNDQPILVKKSRAHPSASLTIPHQLFKKSVGNPKKVNLIDLIQLESQTDQFYQDLSIDLIQEMPTEVPKSLAKKKLDMQEIILEEIMRDDIVKYSS